MNCCTGINGSHTGMCYAEHHAQTQVCWCCGGEFPAEWVCAFSDKGTRCLWCRDSGHTEPCQTNAGQSLVGVSRAGAAA